MKDNPPNDCRVRSGHYGTGNEAGPNGAFFIRSVSDPNTMLLVIASNGHGWDHVSVSCKPRKPSRKWQPRCPTWEEMCQIRKAFFKPEEVCFQLHPAETENRSYHDHCLHLWRDQCQPLTLPPPSFVAPRTANDWQEWLEAQR